MGHVGLTPQAISVIGGFRAQGRTAFRAREIVDDALRLQDAGCFAIVLECVPDNVAGAITETLEIPTIGIGAGGLTSGQVLVFHDMLGMTSHPHHAQFVPKFCKKYAQLGHIIQVPRTFATISSWMACGTGAYCAKCIDDVALPWVIERRSVT